MKIGDKVRIKNKKRTARIVKLGTASGNPDWAYLDKPLGGFRWWNADELELVK